MAEDRRYRLALTAGVDLLDYVQANPDAPKHVLLGKLVFVILDAIYEDEAASRAARMASSAN